MFPTGDLDAKEEELSQTKKLVAHLKEAASNKTSADESDKLHQEALEKENELKKLRTELVGFAEERDYLNKQLEISKVHAKKMREENEVRMNKSNLL